MSLFSLPCDTIRVILQRISLQDIARLIIATNNRKDCQTLQEAVFTLHYSPFKYRDISESWSLYGWVKRTGIRLTSVFISNPCYGQMKYIHELRDYISGIYFVRSDQDTVYEKVPLLMDSYPNLKYIISNLPLVYDNLTIQQGLRLKSITLFNCAMLTQLPNLKKLNWGKLSLTANEAETIIASCPKLKSLSTNIDNYEGLQYLIHSRLSWLKINSKIPTTTTAGPPYVPVQYASECNIVSLEVSMRSWDSTLIGMIADNCIKLQTLIVSIRTGNYTTACAPAIAKLLTNCKCLKEFRYKENATTTNSAASILHSLFNTGHEALVSISIRQVNLPSSSPNLNAIIVPLLNLKKLYLVSPLLQSTLLLLHGCTSLVHLDYDSSSNKSDFQFDVKMLYHTCSLLKSIRYTGRNGHLFFQHSHEHLELLTIIGDIGDKYISAQVASINISFTSFPSLQQLEISGTLDPNSWTRIMMSTAMKGVHKLVLSDANIVTEGKHSIIDSILHHSNFSGLRLVCCAKAVARELTALIKWSERDIEFSQYIIFTQY